MSAELTHIHESASCTRCPLSHRLAYVPGEWRCKHPVLDDDSSLLVGGYAHAIHPDCPLRQAHLMISAAIGS